MADTSFTYGHNLAICTLADDTLNQQVLGALAQQNIRDLIVAPLRTENLGIEQIIAFAIEQPYLNTILVCGQDARQSIGHRPGQTLVALKEFGLDPSRRVIGSEGKRPFIHNLPLEAVDHFREHIEVIDLVDCQDLNQVLHHIEKHRVASPSQTRVFKLPPPPEPIAGEPRPSLIQDPLGYMVISTDIPTQEITLKHYDNTGKHLTTITGQTAAAIYDTAIAQQIISRLDHSAYLGKELFKAELALKNHQPYIQDEPWPVVAPKAPTPVEANS